MDFIKKAYLIASTVLTVSVIAGGFTVIFINNNPTSVSWAQELIYISLALWMPSPLNSVRKKNPIGTITNTLKQLTSTDTQTETIDDYTETLAKKNKSVAVDTNEISEETSRKAIEQIMSSAIQSQEISTLETDSVMSIPPHVQRDNDIKEHRIDIKPENDLKKDKKQVNIVLEVV